MKVPEIVGAPPAIPAGEASVPKQNTARHFLPPNRRIFLKWRWIRSPDA
jgi:hypothetical protein